MSLGPADHMQEWKCTLHPTAFPSYPRMFRYLSNVSSPLLSVPLSLAMSPSRRWLAAHCSVRYNENHMTDGLSEMI